MRRSIGKLLSNLVAAVMILTFIFNAACYFGVWMKIRRQGTRTKAQPPKYGRTAKVMMSFVAAYLAQWWTYVAYATWGIFREPHVSIIWGAVFFSNMGGVFNFLAYTFIRRKYQQRRTKTTDTSNFEKTPSGHPGQIERGQLGQGL